MNGQLLQVCRPIGSFSELMILVPTLRQEVADLGAEVQRLQRENLELRQQAGYWKSRHRDGQQRITELEQKVEQLEGEKRQLKADLFGRRTETTSRSDRSNDLDDPQDDSEEPQRKRGQQPNPGQVFQLSAYRTLAGLVAAVGFGLGTGHRHRRAAAVGSPAQADLRSAPRAESARRSAPSR